MPPRSFSPPLPPSPLRPCLSSQQRVCKKKVVFADSKGMSLTAIHVFSKFDDEPYRNKPSRARSLVLDFKQPSADYLDFRNRLIQNSVCLENCSLQERSLSGTIKVRNIGFEKSVQLRATFDSWASFTDIDCTYMNNVYSCQDTDTFAFILEMPTCISPHNRVEFCICFKVQDQTFWDNNDGKNYALKHVGWNREDLNILEQRKNSEHKSVKLLEMEFDQLGSPRTCSGLFPGWQSWGQIDNTMPYW
uniref:Protein phosphatase 1 regulatory subunit n=1 Tax=Mola mola TaxID=94237 RepID=A0A3Q3WLY5_MOLML